MRMTVLAMPMLLLAVASCDSSPPEKLPDPPGRHDIFACVKGPPGPGLTIPASVTIPPKGHATVTVTTPPGSPLPVVMPARCEVDRKWCVGNSCGGDPPVDFHSEHGGKLAWEQSDSDQSVVYTATAYNDDPKSSHLLTLVVEMPANWVPK